MNSDNPSFRTPEEELRVEEYAKMKVELEEANAKIEELSKGLEARHKLIMGLADAFEVPESVISRWASGTAKPHPLIRKKIAQHVIENSKHQDSMVFGFELCLEINKLNRDNTGLRSLLEYRTKQRDAAELMVAELSPYKDLYAMAEKDNDKKADQIEEFQTKLEMAASIQRDVVMSDVRKELALALHEIKVLEAKLRPNHIVGKAYDLTQENFNKVIRELEAANERLRRIAVIEEENKAIEKLNRPKVSK